MTMQHRVEVVGAREASFGDAFARVMQLSERVIFDHMELLKLDAEDHLRASVQRMAMRAIGGICLLLAWAALLGAMIVALSNRFPLDGLLVAVSGFHVCLAVGLLLIARPAESSDGGQR